MVSSSASGATKRNDLHQRRQQRLAAPQFVKCKHGRSTSPPMKDHEGVIEEKKFIKQPPSGLWIKRKTSGDPICVVAMSPQTEAKSV